MQLYHFPNCSALQNVWLIPTSFTLCQQKRIRCFTIVTLNFFDRNSFFEIRSFTVATYVLCWMYTNEHNLLKQRLIEQITVFFNQCAKISYLHLVEYSRYFMLYFPSVFFALEGRLAEVRTANFKHWPYPSTFLLHDYCSVLEISRPFQFSFITFPIWRRYFAPLYVTLHALLAQLPWKSLFTPLDISWEFP